MTNPPDSGDARGDALRFFGVVTASVSHELNNVNSTIEQIAGLLEDHLALVADGRPVDPQKLQSVQERIVRQTRRAAEIIERLNRFAHSADDPRTRFDLNVLAENLGGLLARLAQRRRVELRVRPAAREVWLEGDPFRLSRLVFGYLQCFWQGAAPGAEIEIGVSATDAAARLELASPPWPDAAGQPWPPAVALPDHEPAAEVAGEVGPARWTVTLTVPLA